MKIKQIMLKNFATVNHIELNLTDSVTYIIGENGSGKTTVGLNAIWFILEGLALKGKNVLHGDRFRFIGNHGPSAVGTIVLHDNVEKIDITISRKLLKNKTELKITASDKRQLPADFIDDIFNIFSINPAGFAKLTPQEQSIALGVDTSTFDESIKIAYDERKELGRDVKRLEGALEEFETVEAVEPVDIKKLLSDKACLEKENLKAVEKARSERDNAVQEAIEYNNKQDQHYNDIMVVKNTIDQQKKEIKELQEKIKELKQSLVKKQKNQAILLEKQAKLPTPADKKQTNIPVKMPKVKSLKNLNQQIESAEATNQKAALYQQRIIAVEKHADACKKHIAKQNEMDKIKSDRIEYIKSCNLPFSNITVDDTGGILINDRPFNETYFSKGEILRIGAKLAATANPKLKYVFIPDSQSIDKKNREKLFKELTESGFQVVAEYVDTEKQKDHDSILLRERKIVESYNEETELNEI
jgi:chromosome segregation ATPase